MSRVFLAGSVWGLVIQMLLVTGVEAGTGKGFYGRASVGYTVYENLEEEYGQVVDFSKVDVSDTFGFEVNLGWQFTKVFGVELAYVNFGEYTVEETYDGIVDGGREIYKGEENGELEAAGLLMRATLPLADKFDVFGRLGLVYWEISSEGEEIALDENGDEVFSGTWSSLGDLDGISPLIGFGIDYQIMDNWSVYGEFLYLMAEKEDWEQTAYGVFLGAEYRFSGGLSGSNRGSSSRKNTACDPKYKDIGGIMCE